MIDEVGNAYNEADFSSPELTQNHLIKIVDKGLSRVKVGDNILDQPYVQYVSSLKEQLQSLGLSIEGEYWTPALAADEINVKVTGGEELYFSTLFPLKSAIETLNIVLKKELSGNQPSEITYIDLRTENKVFYKLNAAAPPVENVDNQNTDKNKK